MPHERDEDFKGCSAEGVCGGAMAITRKNCSAEGVDGLRVMNKMNSTLG